MRCGQAAQGVGGGGGHVGRRGVGQVGAASDQRRAGQAGQGFAQCRVGADDDGFELVDGLGAGLDRGGAGQAEHAQHLHRPVAGLGGAVGSPGQDGVGGGDGVDGVGFAVAAAGGTVGAVDLHHGDVVAAQVSGQRGAVAAGAFHSGTVQHAETTRPGQQLPVAGGGGRELGAGQRHAQDGDDRGDVDVLVGVDTEDDLLGVRVGRDCSRSWCGMLGIGCSSPDRLGWRMAIAGPAGRSEL